MSKSQPEIEFRGPDFGFVYLNGTRVGFTYKDNQDGTGTLEVWEAIGWESSGFDRRTATNALKKLYQEEHPRNA